MACCVTRARATRLTTSRATTPTATSTRAVARVPRRRRRRRPCARRRWRRRARRGERRRRRQRLLIKGCAHDAANRADADAADGLSHGDEGSGARDSANAVGGVISSPTGGRGHKRCMTQTETGRAVPGRLPMTRALRRDGAAGGGDVDPTWTTTTCAATQTGACNKQATTSTDAARS